MITDNTKDDDFLFLSLNKHPSFGQLSQEEKNSLVNLIQKIREDGASGYWLISSSELEINNAPFAYGSFSTVHDCVWRGGNVAIKKPLYNKINNLAEFLREIEVWSTIRHPNLVQFMGASFNETKEEIYIIMEKINGNNLKQCVGKLNLNKKYILINQLIALFKFLHNCNPPIIYRDLKPENILIDNNNIKLSDFGLSKHYITDGDGNGNGDGDSNSDGDSNGDGDSNNDNYLMTPQTGTLRYMAPEVFLKRPYNLKVDIYSLGLIIYFIITNENPFNTYSKKDMESYFNKDDSMFSTRKINNKEIRTIINNCINKDVAERWDINKLYNEWNSLTQSGFKCVIS
jgi:serine/threonine protein kinase